MLQWEDAQEFICRLNARAGEAGYRPQTETARDYAVWARTSGDSYAGDRRSEHGRVAQVELRRSPAGGWEQGAELLGAARHPGERAEAGAGPVRRRPRRPHDG